VGALFSVHNGELLISMCPTKLLTKLHRYILVETITLSVKGSTGHGISFLSPRLSLFRNRIHVSFHRGAARWPLHGATAMRTMHPHESETEFDDFRSHHRSTANGKN
jgi:hypothetical protein